MQFAHPNILWLLLVVPPAMVAFFWWSARQRRELLGAFIQARLLPGLLAGVSENRQRFRSACLILSVCCLLLALARPQWGFTWEEVKQRGLDIVVAIDISKSMLAEDIAPNRLARAKLAALDLMQLAKSDRLGLVAFAGSAFLQCPLTVDDSVFRQSVEGLDVQSLSRGGTAISEAIEAAMGAFTEGDNYKVLVLLTDGEDHDSGALEVARQAAAKGLEIFCMGIGTPEGEMVRAKDASGKMDFIRDEKGNAVKSRLNEAILQELAGMSHRGFYLPLRGAKAIDALYEKGLAPMPKGESAEKHVKRYHERFQWPLGAAIVLLMIEMLFPERKRQNPLTFRKPLRSTATAVLLLLLWAVSEAPASTGAASRAYESGDYETALREYKEGLRRGKSNDPRLHFNAGAAAYKSRQLEEAANQFNEALASQDLQLQQRAFYNRGNTFYSLGEASPDPSHKTKAWENSLKDFESALKLDPKDQDAAFNRELVKRRLEELKQQQQQDKKDDQKKDDKQDQKQPDQQNQQEKEDQQKQQDKQEQQPQSQNQQKDSEDKKPEQQPEKKPEEKQDQQKDQQPQQSKPEDQKEEKEQEQQAASPGKMTPEQARQLLDAEKGEEKVLQFKPEEKPADSSRPIKDW